MNDQNNFLLNSNIDRDERSKQLRKRILDLVKEYSNISHNKKSFVPGKSLVPVSGKIYDDFEIQMLISSSLDFWLTGGRFNIEFESQLAKFLNVNFAMTTNSGSSSNLLAFSSLTSKSFGKAALHPGDEVMTVAACFPTTVNPILQNNLIPVFVDIEIPTYNIDVQKIEEAISDKTKVIMIAHTLGNPFNIDAVMRIAKKYDLLVIEDCCDALGSLYGDKLVGNFGDIATLSFYPAHQITTGEGGAVFTNNSNLKRIVESLRDWGRDCFCLPGKSNTCGKRFNWKLGDLPEGYDHKYTYSNLGYNLKMTDMQAAVGLAQLQKLPKFIEKRRKNFSWLKKQFSSLEDYFILPQPTKNSTPAWFGFPITLRENASFTKNELTKYLSGHMIDSRPMFAGNITKQPYFKNRTFKVSDSLTNTDLVMDRSFWIGVFPGISEEMMEYTVTQFEDFIKLH
jgi:CDP-6-deoxy-D-xylo-4-hexulose-3-dehydrase